MKMSVGCAAALVGAALLISCGKKADSKDPAPADRNLANQSGTSLDSERAELEKQRAELEKQRDALKSQLDAAKQELAALRAAGTSDGQIAAKQREIDALKAQVQDKSQEVEELKVSAGISMKLITGLWQLETPRKLGTGNGCRLLVEISDLAYKKVLVCDEGAETALKLAYETGTVSAITEEITAAPNALNATLKRGFVTKPAQSSCKQGYLATTTSFDWKPTLKDAISVVSGQTTIKGLFKDSEELEAATCEQILGRPGRFGLEKAVAACRVFAATAEQLASRTDVGCFADADPLTFTAAQMEPIQ